MKPQRRPTVSILIPAFNAEDTIIHALESCINQTIQPLEILVADDGSSDCTLDLISQYVPRVKVISHSNMGQAATLNSLASLARGEYLVLLDADDWNAPERVEVITENLIQRNSEILTHDFFEVFSDGHLERHYESNPWHEEGQLESLLRGNFIFGNPAIRRSTWQALGGLNEHLLLAEDFDFFLRALLSGVKIDFCPQALYYYRLHPAQKSSKITDSLNKEDEIIRLRLSELTPESNNFNLLRSGLAYRRSSITRAWLNSNWLSDRALPPRRRDLFRIFRHSSTTAKVRLKAGLSIILPELWLRTSRSPGPIDNP